MRLAVTPMTNNVAVIMMVTVNGQDLMSEIKLFKKAYLCRHADISSMFMKMIPPIHNVDTIDKQLLFTHFLARHVSVGAISAIPSANFAFINKAYALTFLCCK